VAITLPALLLAAVAAAAGVVRGPRAGYELGIALAFSGDTARAESVFVAMLSRSPGDAAAFTNLGNLHMLRGDAATALAFYRRAEEADSADAGIMLNQATALLADGRDAEAADRARLGMSLAGGAPQAASLLGLRLPDETQNERGADAGRLSREELIELLRVAAGRVPMDSTRTGTPADSTGGTGVRRAVLRPAGPRAEDAGTRPVFLYWKR